MILLKVAELRKIEAQHESVATSRSFSLMELAGSAAARTAQNLCAADAAVLVCAGPGNNGGDAFVLARELHRRGKAVVVHFPGNAAALPTDARVAHRRCIDDGITMHESVPEGNFGLVVDGLFGIGLTRPIEGKYADLIARINAFAGPVLALDIPSGLDADTGNILGCAVRASHTITFIAAKPGLYTLAGPDHCGRIQLETLKLDVAAGSGAVLSLADYAHCLRPRLQNSHKGSNGSLAVIGGAEGMLGAAILAARAGLHLGAGRVFVGTLAPIAIDPSQPELMMRNVASAVEHGTALVIGPGLGLSNDALEIIRRTLFGAPPAIRPPSTISTNWRDPAHQAPPLLLDADALTLIGAHPVLAKNIARYPAPLVLTPHPAEAARLLQCETDEIQADRVGAALRLARRFHAIVALKGCGTVVAHFDGRWRINTRGNAGLASGGTGDVLAGMTGALLAQSWPAWEALGAAVQLHGAAAEYCVQQGSGPIGLTASEIIGPARQLLNTWTNESGLTR